MWPCRVSYSTLQSHVAVFSLRIDFPPAPPVTAKQATVRHEFLEVTTINEIMTEGDYLEELSKHNINATTHENRTIQELLGLECRLHD